MDLSVIIPTFNRADSLSRALDSVFAQSNSNEISAMEVIVVDDGSTDGTEQMVSDHYPAVRYLKQPNQGVSAARNRGLLGARGEWIALLDSDDEWLPDKLDQQFSLLRSSGLKVCHTEEIWIRNGVRVNQMNKHRKQGGHIFENCLPLCAMSPSSIVVHRSVFDVVGSFDESLPACEDYDLWLRIAARYEVAFVDEPCIRKFGGHADQLSRQYWGMDRFRVIALEKILLESDASDFLNSAMKRAALSMLLKKLKILLNGALKHENSELSAWCATKLKRWGDEC